MLLLDRPCGAWRCSVQLSSLSWCVVPAEWRASGQYWGEEGMCICDVLSHC